MIKLIVSDVDGTLLHHHETIHPEDVRALREAQRSGITVAFASGRMLPELQGVMTRLDMKLPAVSQNGAYVHTADGELIHSAAFERELIASLAEAADGLPFTTLLAAPDHYVVKRLDDKAERLRRRLFAPLVELPELHERLGRQLVCGKISYMGEIEPLRELGRRLQAEYGDAIEVYISDSDCLDVMPRISSKGAGLAALLDHMRLKPEEAVSIGDAFNDLPMFAMTPNSFAMASSHADVQSKAAFTVHRVADAVAWALERR